MTRILLVGFDPETEDFSDGSHPPGSNARTIEAGIAQSVEQMRARGWTVDTCFIPFRENPEAVGRRVRNQAESAFYDCVVMGGGIRLPGNSLVLEAVINAIHRAAPHASIALNNGPEDSANAAARRLSSDKR